MFVSRKNVEVDGWGCDVLYVRPGKGTTCLGLCPLPAARQLRIDHAMRTLCFYLSQLHKLHWTWGLKSAKALARDRVTPEGFLPPVRLVCIIWHFWSLTADCSTCQMQILIIPGNPGSAEYYLPFILALASMLKGRAEVSAISQFGHSHNDGKKVICILRMEGAPACKDLVWPANPDLFLQAIQRWSCWGQISQQKASERVWHKAWSCTVPLTGRASPA